MGKTSKILIVIGIIFIITGLLFEYSHKYFPLGKLPGDIIIKKNDSIFYFPITTSVILSIALTLLFSFFNRNCNS